jgi:hypothetical protein
MTAETVESPVRGDTHAGFGERPAETGRWRHTPASRPASATAKTPESETCPSTTWHRTGSGWPSPPSAADLLAWTARLALPASAATYEPKRLRLRILAVAGRIVRTARRRTLKIDPAWPWANVITTAQARLSALPVP